MKRLLSVFLAMLLVLGNLSIVFSETSGAITLTTGNIKSATLASGSEISYTSKAVGLACGSSALYDMSSVSEGIYDVTFNYSTQDSDTGLYLAFYIGDRLATKVNLKNTTGTATYENVSVGTFELSPTSDIKVLCTSYVDKTIYLASITLTPSSEAKPDYDFRQYADNATYTVSEDGTVSLVNGTDYYENDASGTFTLNPASTLDDGNKYRARVQNDAGNEWTRYDIKGLMSGTYNVTFRAGVRSATDLYFYVGTGNALSTTPQVIFDAAAGNNGGSSYTVCDNTISLTIPADAEYLYVKSVNKTAYIHYYDFEYEVVEYNVSFNEENVKITGEATASPTEDYVFTVEANTGAEIEKVYAVVEGSTSEIAPNDLGNGSYSISKSEITNNLTIYAKATAKVSDSYQGKMECEISGDNLLVRTAFDDDYELVQRFFNLTKKSHDANEPFDFGSSGLIPKGSSIDSEYLVMLSGGVDEAAPFKFNSSYIGANHGYSKGVLVQSTAHGKTYADIGSLWKDSDEIKWNLLKIVDENSLLFLSENTASSTTKYKVKDSIAGEELVFVEAGEHTETITIESQTPNQQIYSANKNIFKKVYAIKDGIKTEVSDGQKVECDYIDVEEKYYIMNPVLIGEALRENRPQGGYTEPQDMAVGQPLVECNLIYRIMPDSTVLTIFDHKILESVNFDYYGAMQYRVRSDAFGGGIYRYIPKSKEFAHGDMTFDYREPVNMTKVTYPSSGYSFLMTSDYWENQNSMPDRQTDYYYDSSDNIKASFVSGYLPIDDGAPEVRKTKSSVATYVYKSKKTYPYFVDSLAFEETGTQNQTIKGVAYKKFNGEDDKNITHYTIPYGDETYVYIDCHEVAKEEIDLTNILKTGAIAEVLEKTNNVSYSENSGKLTVEMKDGTYGYLVLNVKAPKIETQITQVSGAKGEVNISVKNNQAESADINLYIAGYMGGRLKEMKPKAISLSGNMSYSFTENLTPNSFDLVKVFAWENLNGMVPVADTSSKEAEVEYTSKYLGDGFTRLSLNNTEFEAGEEREFNVEIKESGDYAVFLNQVAPAANGYSVKFTKDDETIILNEYTAADESYNNANYVRVGAEGKKESKSVSLSKGLWTMTITSLADVDISYVDLRSTIISLDGKPVAIYPSDYNYLKYVGGTNYVNEHINQDSHPRIPLSNYFADYLNEDLDEQFAYGRGMVMRGNSALSYTMSYKLDVKKADVYKIKAVMAYMPRVAITDSNKTATFRIVADGIATDYNYTFDVGTAAYKLSSAQCYEKIVSFSEGDHQFELYVGGSDFGAYLHQISVEPYEETETGVTEDGAVFDLAKPEISKYIEDARVLYKTEEYADYTSSIVQNYGMDGMNQSDFPNAIALVWDEIDGAESYTLYVSEDESFNNSCVIKETENSSYDVYNLYPKRTYYWKVVADSGEESSVKHFTTKDTIRYIYAEGGRNIRDIGGWNGLNEGMAYRGAQLDGYDPKYNACLTENGIDVFLNDLKIKTDLDLRGDVGVNILGTYQVHAAIAAYTRAFTTDVAKYATAVRAFADINNYPIYFHCAGGADRTGTVAFIVEAIAGSSEEDLSIDFELTTASRFGSRFRYNVSTFLFADVVSTMKGYDGDTLQEKAENYALNTLGLTRAEVSNIKSILGGNKVVFKNAEDLTVGDTSVELANLNGQKLLCVTLNGNVIEGASLSNDGVLSVILNETGSGEIMFEDGNALSFVVS